MSDLFFDQQSFSEKTVVKLQCKFCDNCLTSRGMMANLIADTSVELYSTDLPIMGNILPVGKVYKTKTCQCQISDIACLVCGNVVGYQVTKPCITCMSSCNNGHFWMFLSEASYPSERTDKNGSATMHWSSLQNERDNGDYHDYNEEIHQLSEDSFLEECQR